jgi:hypothetical protein
MPKHNPTTQGAENRARVSEQDRTPHYARMAASRLVPLDWARPLGIRRADIDVFVAAAVGFEHIIAVRSTNEQSLQYIGQKNYVPKPIDCKPKTADNDAYVAGVGGQVACAGLVVDPSMVGFSAFADHKLSKAENEWLKFLKDKTDNERERKIFRRRGAKGFYAVDTDKTSKHFGCLMLSEQDVPGADFSLNTVAWKDFKRNHLRYVHGDYDLYGLIDVMATEKTMRDSGGRDRFSPTLKNEPLHGMPHIFTEQFEQFKVFINTGIGVDMIQHAGQDNVGHQGDTLYVFYPDRCKYQLTASADAIKDIYRYLFQQDVKR